MSDWVRWIEQLGRRDDLTNQRFALVGVEGCGKAALLKQWLSGERVGVLSDKGAVGFAELAPDRSMRALAEKGAWGMADVQQLPPLTEYLKRSEGVPNKWGVTASAGIDFPESIHKIRLRPLTEGEIQGRPPHLIKRLLAGSLQELVDGETECSLRMILDKAALGGFPSLLHLNFRQRSRDYRLWIETLIQKDLPAVGTYRQRLLMERMLDYCACRSSEVSNLFRMAEDLGKTRVVTKKYFDAVKRLFVVDELPAWTGNRGDRVERSPKLMFCDSGYVSWQANVRRENLETPLGNTQRQSIVERIVKTWVYQQLAPLTDVFRDWHLYHYRSYKGQTVDFLLKRDDGILIVLQGVRI